MYTTRVVVQPDGSRNLSIEWYLPRAFALEVDAMSTFFGIDNEQTLVEIGDTEVRMVDLVKRVCVANPNHQPQMDWVVVRDDVPFPVLPLRSDALNQRVDELVSQANDHLPSPVQISIPLRWARDIDADAMGEQLIRRLLTAEILAWQSYVLGRNGLVLSLLDLRQALVYSAQWPLCEVTRDAFLVERERTRLISQASDDLLASAGLADSFDRILASENAMDDGPELL